MKRNIVLFISVVSLASCAPKVKPIYYWGNYANASDKFLKRNTEKDVATVKSTFEDILANEAKGVRGVPPPGVCADYGFFLLQAGENARGMELLKKEMTLYPESQIFIEQILKSMQASTK